MDIVDTSQATLDIFRPLPSQRRLARPGLHRVQPAPRPRSRRRGPAREGPLGDPAHPAGRHPGPGRDLRLAARAAPAHRLALGPRMAGPLGHGHHYLTTRPQPAPRKHLTVEEPDRPADPPRLHAGARQIIPRHRHQQSPESPSVDEGSAEPGPASTVAAACSGSVGRSTPSKGAGSVWRAAQERVKASSGYTGSWGCPTPTKVVSPAR